MAVADTPGVAATFAVAVADTPGVTATVAVADTPGVAAIGMLEAAA